MYIIRICTKFSLDTDHTYRYCILYPVPEFPWDQIRTVYKIIKQYKNLSENSTQRYRYCTELILLFTHPPLTHQKCKKKM